MVADCAYSRSGEGLHRFTDPADGGVYLYSDLETFDAHRIYACFDQPDLKATFEFSVIAPADWLVHLQHGADVPGEPAAGRATALAFPAVAADVHLHHRDRGRARTTRCAASTTASRSASTAASRWPATWTRTRSSR